MSSSRQQPNLDLARRMANAIRMLAVDAVEAAQSGHPGAPMGMADIAEVLWNRHLLLVQHHKVLLMRLLLSSQASLL